MRKKALFPAIAMVIVSLIVLSSVTYAWFTTGNSATVSNLDVNVVAADGIQVSVDAAAWKSTITAADLSNITEIEKTYANVANQFPTDAVYPVSTAGTVNANGRLEMFKGTLTNDVLTAVACGTEKVDGTGDYIAFDLFFKLDQDKNITLNSTKSTVTAVAGGTDSHAQYASRVAFINEGVATTAAAARDLKGGTSAVIWEPNASKRAQAALDQGFTDGRLGYKGVGIEDTVSIEDGEKTAMTTYDVDSADMKLSLKAGYNKVRIYIWMEGEDVDCLNGTSGGTISTNLVFEAN
ncbi:MAG: hypothetical protein IKU10_05630 [Clostridia bacterium]|nr:hypothetical protein [Clostridia bacterium]